MFLWSVCSIADWEYSFILSQLTDFMQGSMDGVFECQNLHDMRKWKDERANPKRRLSTNGGILQHDCPCVGLFGLWSHWTLRERIWFGQIARDTCGAGGKTAQENTRPTISITLISYYVIISLGPGVRVDHHLESVTPPSQNSLSQRPTRQRCPTRLFFGPPLRPFGAFSFPSIKF